MAVSDQIRTGELRRVPEVYDHILKGVAFRESVFSEPHGKTCARLPHSPVHPRPSLTGQPATLTATSPLIRRCRANRRSFASPSIEAGGDDLELLNALGVCRGERKTGCWYGILASLPAKLRFRHEYMSMLMMCDEKVFHNCHPVRVLAGADPSTGEFIEGATATLGAQHRAGWASGILARVCDAR